MGGVQQHDGRALDGLLRAHAHQLGQRLVPAMLGEAQVLEQLHARDVGTQRVQRHLDHIGADGDLLALRGGAGLGGGGAGSSSSGQGTTGRRRHGGRTGGSHRLGRCGAEH